MPAPVRRRARAGPDRFRTAAGKTSGSDRTRAGRSRSTAASGCASGSAGTSGSTATRRLARPAGYIGTVFRCGSYFAAAAPPAGPCMLQALVATVRRCTRPHLFQPTPVNPMANSKVIPINSLNARSSNITEGKARAPNRSMYYAMGYEQSDFGKPMIGVANGHSTITPCNSGLQKLADAAIAGIEEAGGNAQVFGTPTISDGMAMGTEGMKYKPGQPRSDLRLRRDLRAGPVDGRRGGDRRLRQEHARRPDGHAARQRAGDLRLRRHHPAGPLSGPGPEHRQRVRSGRPERSRQHERRRFTRDREALHSRHRLLRRHVHREHDEQRVRSARHLAALLVDDGESARREGRFGEGVGARAGAGDRQRHQAARSGDAQGDRERRGR